MPRSETTADGFFTSSSGITVYRGAAYPPQYYENLFVAEVSANAIHRETMSHAGVTFAARRADANTEFVRSTDNWFRPVNFVNAPDGTLHVLDMYRETIEHPWSIPDDIKAHLDLESGRDRGRLYRLSPPGFKVPKPPRLGQATNTELVATLESPNSWWRETAQRLLLERRDPKAVEPLRALLRSSSHPLARLHALYTLADVGSLDDDDLLVAMKDAAAGVRERAVHIAEPRLNGSPALAERRAGLGRRRKRSRAVPGGVYAGRNEFATGRQGAGLAGAPRRGRRMDAHGGAQFQCAVFLGNAAGRGRRHQVQRP